MLKLKLPTVELLREVYHTEMKASFPPAELKPLAAIERMWREGRYKPYCLFDGDVLAGCAFLWLGHPGWALLDYLCVKTDSRGRGLGSEILRLLTEAEPNTVIFAEAEAPAHAPDPDMAERRLGFYKRNGLCVSGYDSEVFGVHYKTLYFANSAVTDDVLMEEHRFVYRSSFTTEKYTKYVRIPYDPNSEPGAQVAWDQ